MVTIHHRILFRRKDTPLANNSDSFKEQEKRIHHLEEANKQLETYTRKEQSYIKLVYTFLQHSSRFEFIFPTNMFCTLRIEEL